jgi:cytochrome c553
MNQVARNFVSFAFVLAAAAIGGIYSAATSAQATRVKPGDDLRPAYAIPADIAEGKRVAETTCASCHGANGISGTKGVPHLAGQRPAYLYLELKAYQSGSRADSAMSSAVKPLSDDALVKTAAYYASLDPPQPATTTAAKSAPAKVDPVQAGKAAATACTGCHGDAGITKTPGMPNLVGLHPQYIVAAMKAYKGGQRKNDTMKSILSATTEADLGNIALYYALQKPARAQTPAAGDESAGNAAAAACAGCHGDKGVSSVPTNPSLAGQDAQYLASALTAYKSGARNDETMKALAASLDEATTRNLATFYAKQQPQGINIRKPLSTSEWAQRCDRCHGVDGNSTDPRLPALAGQRADYLEKVVLAYRSGERKSTQMHAMSETLSEADIESLASYYSRQKPRAVVFLILPAK